MSRGRIYLSCVESQGRDIFPWAGLVMASLMLAKDKKPMEIVDICKDIADGNNDTAKAIYSSVYSRIDKLVEIGWVFHRNNLGYVISSKGQKSFALFMDRVTKSTWGSMSDSHILNG